MLLQIASDLHLDHRHGVPFDGLLRPAGDTLALVGDIAPLYDPRYGDFLAWCSARWRHVLLVAGNHEYYSVDPRVDMAAAEARIRRLTSLLPNVRFLQNGAADVDGVRFLGTTLWTHVPPADAGSVWSRIRSYRSIYTAPRQKLTVDHTNTLFDRGRAFVEAGVAAAQSEGLWPVVLTHHAPTAAGTMRPGYGDDGVRSAFATEVDMPHGSIQLWVCGHTHHNFDIPAGAGAGAGEAAGPGCRIIANQMGYPGEAIDGYSPTCTVEVLPHRPRAGGLKRAHCTDA